MVGTMNLSILEYGLTSMYLKMREIRIQTTALSKENGEGGISWYIIHPVCRSSTEW